MAIRSFATLAGTAIRSGGRQIGLLAAIVGGAQAQAPSLVPATPGRPVEVELVTAHRAVVPGDTAWVAVRLKPDPGWHTYWRYPGDVGSAPSVAWDLPSGWKAGPVVWPRPGRLPSPPLASYGYRRELFLATPVEVPETARVGALVRLAARVTWVVCAEECVGGDIDLSIARTVAAAAAIDSTVLRAILAERSRTPAPQGDWTARASVDSTDVILLARPPAGAPPVAIAPAEFFIDSAGVIDHAAPVRARWTDSLIELRIRRSAYANGAPEQVRGVVVLGDADAARAVEVAAPVEPSVGAARTALGARAVETGAISLGPLLMAALLGLVGGTLLNLMPCVLPVLSIKLFGLAEMAGQSSRAARRHALRFGAGVLVSMWVLVGILLALRAAGTGIGWGYQLQSPVMVSLLALLMVAAALNMAGVFTVGPLGGRLLAAADRRSGPVQDLVSGALVVLLATPCSAPFVSSAAGYGLTRGAVSSFVVFTAMGVGLAWPVVLISIAPSLRRLVPKPGAWMVTLRQLLVFPLLGTAAWLVWVVGRQAGVDVMGALLGSIIIVSLALWAIGRLARAERPTARVAGVVLAGAALVAAVGIAVGTARTAAPTGTAAAALAAGPTPPSGLAWQPFSDSSFREARRSGDPVLLDVTADWCLTCKVNERVAFESDRVRAALDSGNVRLVRADWTARSPEITRLITGFGRAGVPVVVLYPPGDRSEPVLLPTLLTPGIVIRALHALPGAAVALDDAVRVADPTRSPIPSRP